MASRPPPTQAERIEGLGIQDMVEALQARGYHGTFVVRAGGAVECLTCHTPSPAERVVLRELLRVEGASDPGSEAAVAALQCPRCGARGTLALTYGANAPREDGEVLRKLRDERPGHKPA